MTQISMSKAPPAPAIDVPESVIATLCRHCQAIVDPMMKGVRLMKKSPPREWVCPT